MPAPFFPNSYAFSDAALKRTALALSKIRLFQFGFSPTPATVIADLEAEECDYDGYVEKEIAAWLAPVKATGGGAQITAPTTQFDLASDPAVGNSVGGYWIETAAGVVVLIRQFDSGVSMSKVGDYVQIMPTIVVPNGT